MAFEQDSFRDLVDDFAVSRSLCLGHHRLDNPSQVFQSGGPRLFDVPGDQGFDPGFVQWCGKVRFDDRQFPLLPLRQIFPPALAVAFNRLPPLFGVRGQDVDGLLVVEVIVPAPAGTEFHLAFQNLRLKHPQSAQGQFLSRFQGPLHILLQCAPEIHDPSLPAEFAPLEEYVTFSRMLRVFCDFDGTITDRDSIVFLTESFGDGPDFREDVLLRIVSGEITVFEAIEHELATVRVQWEEALGVLLAEIRIDPFFESFVEWCRDQGVPLSILSSGMRPVVEAFHVRKDRRRAGVAHGRGSGRR